MISHAWVANKSVSCWLLLSMLCGIYVSGCGPSPSAHDNTDGPNNDSFDGDLGQVITAQNAEEFSQVLNDTLVKAIEDMLSKADCSGGKAWNPKELTNRRTLSEFSVNGLQGRIRANGLEFGTFWPPRYELTLN